MIPKPKQLHLNRYGEQDRELARLMYELNGGRLNNTAQKIGVNVKVLKQWLEKQSGELEEARKKEREKFVRNAWQVIHRGVDLLKQRLPEGNLKEIATIVAILVDKIAILQKVESTLKLTETHEKSLTISTMSDEQLYQLLRELVPDNKQLASQDELPPCDEADSTT